MDKRTCFMLPQRAPDGVTMHPDLVAARSEVPASVGASSIAAMLGCNKRAAGYPQTYGLWQRMVGEYVPPVPETEEEIRNARALQLRMEEGLRMEPVLRQLLRDELGSQLVIYNPDRKPTDPAECWRLETEEGTTFWATPDDVGTFRGKRVVIDYKWVAQPTHRMAELGQVPGWYRPQNEVQMDCMEDCELAIYVSGCPSIEGIQVVFLTPDADLRSRIRSEAIPFQEAVRNRTPIGDPFLEYGVPKVVDDSTFIDAASRYRALASKWDEAVRIAGFDPKELKAIKEELTRHAKEMGEGLYQPQGSPLTVNVSFRKGYTSTVKPTLVARIGDSDD